MKLTHLFSKSRKPTLSSTKVKETFNVNDALYPYIVRIQKKFPHITDEIKIRNMALSLRTRELHPTEPRPVDPAMKPRTDWMAAWEKNNESVNESNSQELQKHNIRIPASKHKIVSSKNKFVNIGEAWESKMAHYIKILESK